MDGEIKTATSKVPQPDTESWYDYIVKSQQETPQRLEDTAKYLAGMISISLTIFMAFLGKEALANQQSDIRLILAAASWLLSLLFTFFVLFPGTYRYSEDSLKTIKDMHKKVIRRKTFLLWVSLALYLLALCLLTIVFLV